MVTFFVLNFKEIEVLVTLSDATARRQCVSPSLQGGALRSGGVMEERFGNDLADRRATDKCGLPPRGQASLSTPFRADAPIPCVCR